MKLFLSQLIKGKNSAKQNSEKNKQEILSTLGREQFKKLVDRGLGIPVAIL